MKVIYNNKEVANTTLNYNELFNKPLLNSHELVGNTSLNDIGVYSKPQVDNLIASTRSIKVVSALPTPLVANTMYYVGPDANNLYHIYLVDSSLTLIDLGMSQDAVYLGGNGIDISSDNEISVVFDNETLMLNSEGELYVRPATENVEGVVSYDNVSIKKNNSGKIYVPTTKSGDRYDVYPYTDGNGITFVGRSIRFVTSDTETGAVSNIDTHATGSPSVNTGNFWVNNGVDNTKSGIMLTTGLVDNKTIKYDGTNSNIYVNNSTSLTGTTDADKIGMTKGAIQKYTETLVGNSGATVIANNSNLNTIPFTEVGHYLCGGNASAATLTNCPTTSGFRMIVENVVGSDTSSLSGVGGWVSRTRIIENFGGARWVQSIIKEGASDTTITYGAWRRMLDGQTSTSGNRHDVYPYTSGANTAVGKFVDFYVEDASTSATSQLWAPNAAYAGTQIGDLRIENKSDSTRSGTVLTSGIVSLKHWHPTNNTDYISSATIDGYVDHATCVISGWFRLSQDVPANTVLFTLPTGYTIADNTYGFIYGSISGFKLAKAQYNQATIVADGALSANSNELKYFSITFMLSKYPA